MVAPRARCRSRRGPALWPAVLLALCLAPRMARAEALDTPVEVGLLVGLLASVPAALAGVCIAGWLSFAQRPWLARAARRLVGLLACTPTVVLGWVGLSVVSDGRPGLLSGSLVLAIMALPTVIALAERALAAVPSETLVAAYALGADRWETLWGVAVPRAWRGLFAAALLGFGRVLGEAVVAVLACGDRMALPVALDAPARTLAAHVLLSVEGPRVDLLSASGALLLLSLPPVLVAAVLGPADAEAL